MTASKNLAFLFIIFLFSYSTVTFIRCFLHYIVIIRDQWNQCCDPCHRISQTDSCKCCLSCYKYNNCSSGNKFEYTAQHWHQPVSHTLQGISEYKNRTQERICPEHCTEISYGHLHNIRLRRINKQIGKIFSSKIYDHHLKYTPDPEHDTGIIHTLFYPVHTPCATILANIGRNGCPHRNSHHAYHILNLSCR